MGQFVEVCRRRRLKVNAGKSDVMVLNGEEGLKCEVHVDGIRLEHVSEFKYLGCVLDKSSANGAKCSSKGSNGKRIEGPIRILVNARDLQHEHVRVLHETFLVPILRLCGEDGE